ncbi:sensor histidine kinase [Actinoplanes sp. G11-F43]|uniref:sensor histidine kinase n=1 Tax=Actinoplanes sp. G11-F43 TaxID=3424130 RepID=UPI003D3437AB
MWRFREAALVAGVLALDVATALTTADDAERPLWPVGLAIVVGSAVALFWRRRFPYPVLAVTTTAALIYYPLGFPDSPMALAMVTALYTVARDRGPRPALLAAAVPAVAFAAISGPGLIRAALGIVPLLLLPVVLGEIARGRARQTAHAEERAALAEARLATEAAEERLRIARELHDVLAHQLSLITVQSGAALHTRDPDGAFAALGAIRTAGREALHEMRTVLDTLRQDDPPGAADLGLLLERTKAAGLIVRSHVDTAGLPDAVRRAAYRIVQEALTNVLRHASATSVDVEIRQAGDRVVVTFGDDGRGSVATVEGNGMRGMAERAAALGGTFEAGARPGGGFLVTAGLPAGAR